MGYINESVIYNIYPLGFCGAPKENDFKQEYRLDKIYGWIDHMKSMSVNALVFNPVFESSKHGYDTIDYKKIDCRLGDNESFKKICKTLHDNGIRIMLDGVFNHVGRDFFAFKDVQQNRENSRYASWFENVNFRNNSPYNDGFSYEGWAGYYDLVKLNLHNDEVVNYLLDCARFWIDEFDIDGIRLDCADCLHFDFMKELRRTTAEKKEDFWLMGEVIHGDYARWANPELLDSVTNYECWKGLWSAHNTKNYFEIAHSLQRQFGPGGIYKNLALYSFADNHDVNRLASQLTNRRHLENVYTILYTMPGIPSVYYGSEWAVEGARTRESDAPLRPCLELAEMTGRDQTLCAHLSKLASIRAAFPALRHGDFENVVIKNEQLIYRRATPEQRVYVLLNLAEEEIHLEFPHQEPVLQDVLNGDAIFHNDGGRTWLPAPPCSARILVGAPDRFAWSG